MIPIEPKRISGKWTAGYALDAHTLKSHFVGYNEYNHQMFENIYSPMGEALHKLKYEGDKSQIAPIVESTCNFLKKWRIRLDVLTWAPPSNTNRFQHVREIAKRVADRLDCSCKTIRKVRKTSELKNMTNYSDRRHALSNAFEIVNPGTMAGKNILVFDDIYQSGATLNHLSHILKEEAGAENIYVLTLTKTRKSP